MLCHKCIIFCSSLGLWPSMLDYPVLDLSNWQQGLLSFFFFSILFTNDGLDVFDVWTYYCRLSHSHHPLCHHTKTASNGNEFLSWSRRFSNFIILVTVWRPFIILFLQVWGLFAPKFVFDVVGLILTDILICLAWFYYVGRREDGTQLTTLDHRDWSMWN